MYYYKLNLMLLNPDPMRRFDLREYQSLIEMEIHAFNNAKQRNPKKISNWEITADILCLEIESTIPLKIPIKSIRTFSMGLLKYDKFKQVVYKNALFKNVSMTLTPTSKKSIHKMTDADVRKKLLNKDNNGNYIIYDIKDEFSLLLSFGKNETNIAKWKKYRQHRPSSGISKIDCIDCDVCELAVYVYLKAWKFLSKQKILRPTKQYKSTSDETCNCEICNYKYQLIIRHSSVDREYYRGDTMTSFTRTYNHFHKKIESDKEIKKQIKKQIEEQIERFAKLYHTIGNMIPVPAFFNSERSGGPEAIFDFWDLTLIQIKKWYENQSDDALVQLLNPDENKGNQNITKSVECCKQWLKYFENWSEFVKQNYLGAFIEPDGKPIAFWEDHSYKNTDFPKSSEDFLEYIKKLNSLIENRNYLILAELDRILKSDD